MGETPVRIGELIATRDPDEVLISVGLGSCIGLAMIDRARGIAGLAHVMLPQSPNGAGPLPGRYANHAVPTLLEKMVELGASRSAIEVGIAGGAQMFAGSSSIEVGKRNAEAVTTALGEARLRVKASATGGDKGRTVKVLASQGVMIVREVASEEVVLIGAVVGAAR